MEFPIVGIVSFNKAARDILCHVDIVLMYDIDFLVCIVIGLGVCMCDLVCST